MSKHSQAYESKKAKLQKAEADLRKAIDDESENLESTALKYLKIGAVVGTAVIVSYGIYRLIAKNNSVPKTEVKETKEASFVDKIVDKVTDVVAGLAVQNISNYLDKMKSNLEKDLKR